MVLYKFIIIISRPGTLPINHGRRMKGDFYEVDRMALPPAPETILAPVKRTNSIKGRFSMQLNCGNGSFEDD